MDFVQIINQIRDYYKWDKVSILGHSMGSIVGFIYNSLFPERCDMMIGIDVLKPLIRENKEILAMLNVRMEKMLEEDHRRKIKSKPPTYTADVVLEKIHEGSRKSVTKEAAVYLARRSVKESDTEPNRYYFARDNRLKYFYFNSFHSELITEMIQNISAPYFFIKAKEGPYYEDKKYYDEAIAVFKTLPNFHHVTVDGPHHVHLTHPDNVAEPISDFILQHRSDVSV